MMRDTGQRVPLAWRNLTSDWRKLSLALTGVAFAVVLMFTQIGFRVAMSTSSLEIIHALDGDLFLLSPVKYHMHTMDPFPARRLQQSLGHPEVLSAAPVYMRYGVGWKHVETGRVNDMRVVAFDPDLPVFRHAAVEKHRQELRLLDTVLLDSKTRPWLGPRHPGLTTELGRRKVRVIGNFSLGTDFVVNGTVIMGDRSFLNLVSPLGAVSPRLDRVEIGCLKLRDPGRARQVQEALASSLPEDVVVVTRDGFLDMERSFWTNNSPVGKIFNLGLIIGFVVGSMICYQILFTELQEQESQFATLKAIGFTDSYLVRSVMAQSFLMGLLAFVPAGLVSALIYGVIEGRTGLKMEMTLGSTVQLLGLTIVMSLVSARLAVRRVLRADPAEVF